MTITLGEYNPKDLLKPLKETVIRRRGHAKQVIENMNPSSGIWMVSLYRRAELIKQFAVYNKALALSYLRAFRKNKSS